MWDDDDKTYINGLNQKIKTVQTITDIAVILTDFYNKARQGYDFVLDGNESDGFTLNAVLRPTTKKAKENAMSQ